MPTHAWLYAESFCSIIRSKHWIREPVPTYDAGHAAPEICRALAENIRYVRTLRRWSQEVLGLEAGLNRTLIGAIERAEINTSIGTAEKIARALGLSLAELLTTKPPTHLVLGRNTFDG